LHRSQARLLSFQKVPRGHIPIWPVVLTVSHWPVAELYILSEVQIWGVEVLVGDVVLFLLSAKQILFKEFQTVFTGQVSQFFVLRL